MKYLCTLMILSAGVCLADPNVNVIRNSNRNTNVNRNVNQNQSSATVISDAATDIQGLVAWRKYQDERNQKTKKGAPLSPLDSQSPAPVPAPTASPADAQAKYNAFLRSKGINPNTIGTATVVAGRMIVPTIEEQYASRNANIATRLANAAEPTTEAVVSR